MESTSDFLRRLNDMVACPVCLRILDKPKSLPCGHTMCLDCILGVCAAANDDDADNSSVESTYENAYHKQVSNGRTLSLYPFSFQTLYSLICLFHIFY